MDYVYSAAQDSDFLLYEGMGEIIYDLKADGSFHSVELERDVLGKVVGSYNFSRWERRHFVAWSAACGCDYLDNPKGVGAATLYKLVEGNLSLSEDALLTLIAAKAADAKAYRVDLLAAVLSFRHHIVFACDDASSSVQQQHLTPLPPGVGFTAFEALTTDQCRQVMDGVLDPITLQPRVAVPVVDDANQQALEADFSTGRGPEHFPIQRLKMWLVNRGIPVPSSMKHRDQLVELVQHALSYPADAWGKIDPWNSQMIGWTRPDPVQLDARAPMSGAALWELLTTAPFPSVDDAFIHQLMPIEWAGTLERGRKLYYDGMCYATKLELHFASTADGLQVWVLRMPVRASTSSLSTGKFRPKSMSSLILSRRKIRVEMGLSSLSPTRKILPRYTGSGNGTMFSCEFSDAGYDGP